MYTITTVEDFSIYKASRHALELYTPLIHEAKASNEEFLKTTPTGNLSKPITGTFIYAHPPNYRGLPTLKWGVSQWRSLLQKFRSVGMDTVIFQAAVWNELGECYYPSRTFQSHRMWNVLEPMLEATTAEKIRVFIGGYGSTTGWMKHLSPETAAREERTCIACLTELLQDRDAFEGFYFPSETAYTGSLDRSKSAQLNRIYRTFFNHIKETDDRIRILMSPATKYFPGKDREMEDHWIEMLQGVPLDILAPQDSIGTCGSRLRHADGMYRIWKSLCSKLNIDLWANIEIFERNDLALNDNSITAKPERVIAQVNIASPYVDKLICWEAPHYLFGRSDSASNPLLQRVFASPEPIEGDRCAAVEA